MKHRKKPLEMLIRLIKLLFAEHQENAAWVTSSYDRISGEYDHAWTTHMRHLTDDLIERLDINSGDSAVDLTCGTGYAARLIARRTEHPVIGVDASEGMLDQARTACADRCTFVQADILDYLKTMPDESVDVITCCWGLGYSKPLSVLRQIRRILKKGGTVGIIDNTLFSLREILWVSMLTFMEQPETLEHLMTFRFLTGRRHLSLWYRLAGLRPSGSWGGEKRYIAATGTKAIARLQATGAAAGFEYAAQAEASEEIFARCAEILQQRYGDAGGIPIVHRYLAGVAHK